jgi:hypothetical protein
VNAAIPTLLTALGSVASTRDGARDLAAAMATPVVGDTLKPFVDALRSKLNALGTA